MGWLDCVDQVRPPLYVIVAPPSLPRIIRSGSSGSIQRSWLSPCGTGRFEKLFPPSVDLCM